MCEWVDNGGLGVPARHSFKSKTMKIKLRWLVLATVLSAGAAAQEAEPEPAQILVVTNSTAISPPTLKVTVELSPVVKRGTNKAASIISVTAVKMYEVRKLVGGVQTGEVELRTGPARNILPYLLTKTNVNGVLALNLNPDKATLLWAAWNNSTESGTP